MTKPKPTGTITYTGRAFHQDANEAMKGDIVRGIIELITNSDDSYSSMDDSTRQKIVIEVEHRRGQTWQVIVRDRAAGMSANTMLEAMTELGGRTSGFELGLDTRGNLGRGAKDVAAFGDVIFRSIKKDQFSELVLRSSGDWALTEDAKCQTKDRKLLGIKGNGTVVEIRAMESVRCPRHDTLKRRISTHYQLRDILSDPQRKVELVNINDNSRDLLIYQYPDVPVVFEGDLKIPGYPDAKAHLIIRRHNKRYEEGSYDPGRPNGILIKGSRAIYDNTLFEHESSIYSGWFTGELSCKYIDRLAREYDDIREKGITPPTSNPLPIISRYREGLNSTHPFVEILYSTAAAQLAKLILKEEEKAKSELGELENQQTKSDLDRLAKEASKLMSEELKDIEAEELPPTGTDGEVPELSIVPEIAYAYVDENRTLTIAARKEGVALGDEVEISLDPEGVVQLHYQTVELRHHSRREDILVGQIRMHPLIEGESTLVTARINGRRADAIVEVRPPREIIDEEIEPPDTFMFERPSYRIGWKKGKDIFLIAPADVVGESGDSALLASSDPGVIVKNPTVQLEFDKDLDYFRGKARVEARSLHATAEISAKLGDLRDTAQVKVTRKEDDPGVKIRLEPDSFGIWRALIETETDESGRDIRVIRIAGRHPGIRHVLGDDFEGQDSAMCRLIMAEIVGDVAARHVVNELFKMRRTTEEFDSERFYREHYKRVKRFLPRFQRILVGNAELVAHTRVTQPN